VLLRDDFFDDMSKPFVLSITKFSLSHLDGRLMMRLHQHHEILVDIPLRLYAHILHHVGHDCTGLCHEGHFVGRRGHGFGWAHCLDTQRYRQASSHNERDTCS
jgi:hypothetical protein